MGVYGQRHPLAALPPGKRPVSYFARGWVDWCGNLAVTGIRSPVRPHRSESLFRLRYRGPLEAYNLFVLLLNTKNQCVLPGSAYQGVRWPGAEF
jgi:hypothetical protein